MGIDWSVAEMQKMIKKGPHSSALVDDTIAQIQVEAREKEKQGFAILLKWRDIAAKPPRNIKISPLARIQHKSQTYRAILDLSFTLKVAEWSLPSVNDTTERTVPY